ncbi:hypothetical protein [Oceanithermus sp.]
MKQIQRLFRTPARALAAETLNLFIEVENRAGIRGLDALERELRAALTRLERVGHPERRRLEGALAALAVYRAERPRARKARRWQAGRPSRRATPASAS